MHLYYAKTIAETLRRELEPFCEPERCKIAGSILRGVPMVKYIELVCIPKKSIHREKNLFDEIISERQIIHPEFERIIRESGTIIKGKFTGRMMQVEMKREFEGMQHTIMLDLFMPVPHDYFRQLAIRTGSADYAHYHIANAWLKIGWCGVNGDLRRQAECYKKHDKAPWELKNNIHNPTLPPVWKSEKEFFNWLGEVYLEPKQRNL